MFFPPLIYFLTCVKKYIPFPPYVLKTMGNFVMMLTKKLNLRIQCICCIWIIVSSHIYLYESYRLKGNDFPYYYSVWYYLFIL